MMKSSLSTPQQRLLEIMQKINYGRVEQLSIRDGEPVLKPVPRLVRDLKLGAADNGARPELHSPDFPLKREHLDLFESFRAIKNGVVECLEIKAGLPFRITTVEEQI